MKLLIPLLFCFLLHAHERYVALSPAIAEILYGLGLGSDIVGVSDFTTFPKEAATKEKVGGYFNTSLEKVVSLEPTLVIGQSHNAKLFKQLRALHIKTLMLKFYTLKDIEQSIKTLGEYTSRQNAADRLLTDIKKAVLANTHTKNSKRVLIVFGTQHAPSSTFYIAGHDLYYEDIIKICGAENAYNNDYSYQPALTYEQLYTLNPTDVIVLAHKQQNSASLNSVETFWHTVYPYAAVHIRSEQSLSIPSQRVAQSITTLCALLTDDNAH